MQKLRSIHLYLGCVFAPMLLFFAMSGIWQTLGFHTHWMERLSTIHTSRNLKIGGGLASPLMLIFVVIMAVSFIVTTVLGVIMAVRFGRSRRAAVWCLVLGVVFPVAMVVSKLIISNPTER